MNVLSSSIHGLKKAQFSARILSLGEIVKQLAFSYYIRHRNQDFKLEDVPRTVSSDCFFLFHLWIQH